MGFVSNYLNSLTEINKNLDLVNINKFVESLYKIKKSKGRLFIIGVGGSAGNASHAE